MSVAKITCNRCLNCYCWIWPLVSYFQLHALRSVLRNLFQCEFKSKAIDYVSLNGLALEETRKRKWALSCLSMSILLFGFILDVKENPQHFKPLILIFRFTSQLSSLRVVHRGADRSWCNMLQIAFVYQMILDPIPFHEENMKILEYIKSWIFHRFFQYFVCFSWIMQYVWRNLFIRNLTSALL
jgi:hypothetical protein